MAETEVFAFGGNQIQGESCPMVTADMSGTRLTTVAEEYDKIVRQRYELHEGTLPKSVAESCWKDAVKSVRNSARVSEDKVKEIHMSRAADMGEEVSVFVF